MVLVFVVLGFCSDCLVHYSQHGPACDSMESVPVLVGVVLLLAGPATLLVSQVATVPVQLDMEVGLKHPQASALLVELDLDRSAKEVVFPVLVLLHVCAVSHLLLLVQFPCSHVSVSVL